MKTGLLICVCTLTVVTFAAGKTYACNLDPVASLSADPNPVCVGQSVTLDGSGSSDPDGGNGGLLNGIKKFEWDWTNDGSYDYSESPGDGIATHTYTIAGTYTAKLRVTDNDAAEGGPPDKTDTATRTVYVVEVDSLLPDEGTEFDDGDGNPDTKSFAVCIADTGVVTVTATPNPSVSEENLPACWTLTGGDVQDKLHTQVDKTTWGHTEITCSAGSSEKTTTIYVVKVKIMEPDENPVTDNNFAFNSATPGVCNVYATGIVLGGLILSPDLEWTLTAISGSTQTSSPDPPKGANITFTYTTLPSSNSQFGEKTLTLTHPDLPGGCKTDIQTVEIFFAKWAYNHVGEGAGTTPNWFYYWEQGAVSNLSSFGYESESLSGKYIPSTDTLLVCDWAPEWSTDIDTVFVNKYYHTSINSGLNGIADTSVASGEDDIQVIPVGQGKPNQTAITAGPNSNLDTSPSGYDTIVGSTISAGPNGVCNTTTSGDDVQVIPVGQGKPYSTIITAGADNFLHSADYNNGSSRLVGDDELDLTGAHEEAFSIDLTGIYKCAVTCSHELKHQELYTDVRLGGSGTPEDPYYYDSGNDGDYVDDYDEVNEYGQYHLDPYRKDTYDCDDPEVGPGLTNDNEFLAYITQSSGSADPDSDWSDTDGAQWQD